MSKDKKFKTAIKEIKKLYVNHSHPQFTRSDAARHNAIVETCIAIVEKSWLESKDSIELEVEIDHILTDINSMMRCGSMTHMVSNWAAALFRRVEGLKDFSPSRLEENL